MKKLLQKLEERIQAGNLRELTVTSGKTDFCSNDYLGFARNKELSDQIEREFSKYNGKVNGSAGSRLLSGNNSVFEKLEEKLAAILKRPSALIFNSGYNANLAVLSAVPQKGDTILYDELCHASLIDGARLSFAKRFSFTHNDLSDLERLLQKAEGEKYVVIESVYSMDGDVAPLLEISNLVEKFQAHLIVDEAHSTGVWGDSGAGMVYSLGLQDKVFAGIYTFGKAMGVHGASVAGSDTLTRFLINFARPFIYTTALPLHSLVAIEQSFSFLKNNQKYQTVLHDNIQWFKQEVITFGLNSVAGNDTAIQIINVAGNENAKKVANVLNKEGFDVRAILSPTVKAGKERIRICLHAFNSKEEISRLLKTIKHELS